MVTPGSAVAAARVGRILTSAERLARMRNEAARSIPDEARRSAFAISASHVLTAWHCVREPLRGHQELWFRLRDDQARERVYLYVPVRVANYDEGLDAAALSVDAARLAEADLTAKEAAAILDAAAITLATDLIAGDRAYVMGFPESASGADSDSNTADVVDVAMPLGDTIGLKLYCAALAAVDPIRPGGLSGGPVLTAASGPAASGPAGPGGAAVGVIRAAPIGSIFGVAAGGGLVASRIADIATRLPEVAVALHPGARPGTAEPTATTVRDPGLPSLFARSYIGLRDTVVEFPDPALGTLTGWSHFLDESRSKTRPTSFGTAYGLKLVLSLDRKDGQIDRSALAETLWKLRKPDGGWAARTQAGIGRPEVTALVLGALSAAGYRSEGLADAAGTLERQMTFEADEVAMTRTYIVSAAIRGLLWAMPASRRLPELRSVLLAGAVKDPERNGLICWSDRFGGRQGKSPVPSIAHTALAVVALSRASQVLGADTAADAAIEQAVRWLSLSGRPRNQVEQLRRFVADDRWDTLTVNYFTAAWVAEAIMSSALADADDGAGLALREAIRCVRLAQLDGIWEWDDQDRPIWMTYQGVRALKAYALRTSRQ